MCGSLIADFTVYSSTNFSREDFDACFATLAGFISNSYGNIECDILWVIMERM